MVRIQIRRGSHVLEFALLKPEEVPRVIPDHESIGLLDALELASTPLNQLALGWTIARGEFDGLRVETPVRMSYREASAWL